MRRVTIRAGFHNNEIAIELGMMAETYGELPTVVAGVRPGEYTRTERFRLDRDIFYATQQRKSDEEDYNTPTDGVGTEGERKELIDKQKGRAEKTHGSLADQMDALN